MLFAYFGPETVLPLASVVATILGAMMMFGRYSLKLVFAPIQWLLKKSKSRTAEPVLRGPTAWRRSKAGSMAETSPTAHENAEEA